MYNHGHSSVAKGHKHRKNPAPLFINVDTIIVLFSSTYSYFCFLLQQRKGGRGKF